MSKNSDTTDTFIFYGGLLALAAFICAPQIGSIIPVVGALYFMLVATNAIARGENKAIRMAQEKRRRQEEQNYDYDYRT
jgi:hypothetical protein